MKQCMRGVFSHFNGEDRTSCPDKVEEIVSAVERDAESDPNRDSREVSYQAGALKNVHAEEIKL